MPRELKPRTSASGNAASRPSCRFACSVVGSWIVVVGSSFGSAPRCSAMRAASSDSPRVAAALIACTKSSKAAPKRPGSGRSLTARSWLGLRLAAAEQQQPPAGKQQQYAAEGLEVVARLRVRVGVVVELTDHAGLVEVREVADQRDQQRGDAGHRERG